MKRIRIRAVAWGLLLCIPVTYWNAWQFSGTIYSMIFSTMAALIVLVFMNACLHRFLPALAFSTADMAVIFGMVSVASAISGEWTFLNMQYVHAFAAGIDRDPIYKNAIIPNLPPGLYFASPDEVRDYVAGGNGPLYFLTKFDIWLPKLLLWTALYSVIALALLCVNSLMRDLWMRKERLSFPVIQLPVAMMEKDGRGPIWKSKALWIAFGIMFSIDMLNGWNYLNPAVPSLPVKEWLNITDLFKEQPYASLGMFPLSLYPFLAALALFMPSDLLFSIVFFFLVRKAVVLLAAANGIEGGAFTGGRLAPEPPYFTEQTWGAIFGLFASAVWISRGHLKQVWREIRSGAGAADGGIPHRWAFLILCGCVAALVGFLTLGGLSPVMMLPYLCAFLIFSFVIARIRAQVGPPTHEFAFMGPNQLLMNLYGTRGLSDKNSTMLATAFLGINRLSRSHPMPVQLEAMKTADIAGVRQGPLFGLLVLALFVGAFLGHMFFMQKGYARWAEQDWGDPSYIVRYVEDHKTGPNPYGIGMMGVGISVVLLLDFIRFRFISFPLHPVGYALSMNFGVDYYWFGLVIALIVKLVVQKFYSLRGYTQLRNVAFGIMIAEYSAELIWATVAMVTHHSTYTIGINERGFSEQ